MDGVGAPAGRVLVAPLARDKGRGFPAAQPVAEELLCDAVGKGRVHIPNAQCGRLVEQFVRQALLGGGGAVGGKIGVPTQGDVGGPADGCEAETELRAVAAASADGPAGGVVVLARQVVGGHHGGRHSSTSAVTMRPNKS